MIEMEVRCCCKPKILLGWLEVNDEAQRLGVVIVRPMKTYSIWEPITPVMAREPDVALDVRLFYAEDGSTYPAIHSGEIPIETLRRIPGFRENRP